MTREEVIEIYDAVVADNPNFDRQGKNMIFTSANGYMFSMVNKAGEVGVRLSKEAQAAFKEAHDSGPYKSHGATMRDYVLVPASMLDNKKQLGKYINDAYEYVMSLPPK